MGPIDADSCKFKIVALRDLLLRKERVIRTEALFLAKVGDPLDDDLANVVADWEERRFTRSFAALDLVMFAGPG
jgi:hypothetical protein